MVQVEDVVGRLRWQLGLERTAQFAIRGAFAAGIGLLAVSLVGDSLPILSATAPLLVAVAFAIWRWPSDLDAARAFDQRAHLDERLATATELARRGQCGRFDRVQIGDAIMHAQRAPRVWLALNRRTGAEALAAAAVLVAASILAIFLHSFPAGVTVSTYTEETTPVAESSLPDELAHRGLPLDLPDQAAALPTPAPAVAPNLASRVQQEEAERSALDKLAQGLSNMSAAQPAADAIQQGNYAAAADQLRNLADNADQLSDAGKQQLARGLQQAATATGQSDKALANREQQAAQALTRSTYVDQRQALQSLADQVQRSAAQSVPADQLARDVGQLQQQQQGNGAAQNGGGQGGQAGSGGPGVGSGPNSDPFSSEPSRLDSSGQRVQVPVKLGNGPGVRAPDGTEDQSAPNSTLTGRSVSELPQSQQTGQVAPEQNLVPGEQRPVVRGYFR